MANPLEVLKKKVSAKSTAGLLRDRKKQLDEQIEGATGGKLSIPKKKKK
jgi:hypothetical protein